jgi:hypothetical protein
VLNMVAVLLWYRIYRGWYRYHGYNLNVILLNMVVVMLVPCLPWCRYHGYFSWKCYLCLIWLLCYLGTVFTMVGTIIMVIT